eukprot:GFUD01045661.1.p1 GENE.GFUD01045661.1~~GFUD01045661.1.p1  ORF type:complete len:430 (-),score=121.11 GFUD01045661.1:52-1341(-)
MLSTVLFSLVLVSASHSLEVVRTSLPSIVEAGEDARLFCEADEEFDSCYWYLPGEEGVRCGPLTQTQSMCRSVNNIHFNGTSTNCQILIKQLKNEQSGDWVCSLNKDGVTVNSTVQLTGAMQATLDWGEGIFGTITLTAGNPKTFDCQARHTRPVGIFLWHLGQDDSHENRFVNENEIIESVGDNKIANVSQILILDPKPELNEQRLFCTYIQEDETGRELFRETTSIELRVHYLSSARDTTVVEAANSGENFNISVKFSALPRPQDSDVVWQIEQGGEMLEIGVEEENFKQEQNYIVYPLQQESQYEYSAMMTILNISAEESEKQHYLKISNQLNSGETLELVQHFDIQVDRIQIAGGDETPLTTIIVIIVLMVIITVIIVIMATVYAKKTDRWCYHNSSRPYVNPDMRAQKEPLQVQHHPYARPSTK